MSNGSGLFPHNFLAKFLGIYKGTFFLSNTGNKSTPELEEAPKLLRTNSHSFPTYATTIFFLKKNYNILNTL